MRDKKVIAIIILAAVIIFGIVGYYTLLSEKESLSQSVNQIKGQLTVLEAENRAFTVALDKERQLRKQLAQEKEALEQTVQAQEERLARLSEAEKTIAGLNLQIAALRNNAQALNEEEGYVKLDFAGTAKESAALKDRQASIIELKKAIKELKRQMYQTKRRIKEKPFDFSVGGNRGFLIREGKSTYPAKIRIEVTPAQ